MTTARGDVRAHTGGPWQTRSDYSLEDRLTIIGNVDGEYIDGKPQCTFDVIAVCTNEFGESLANAEANARLIAAAPELLEALERLDDFTDHKQSCNRQVGIPKCDCGLEQLDKIVSAALAKARSAP